MNPILAVGKSDIGLKRVNNEDAFVAAPEKGLLVVADGMGGAASGEVASQIFVSTAEEVFSELRAHSEDHTRELIQKVFLLANERIFRRASENPEHEGMGCTAELMVLSDQQYVLGHVGDSRTYLFRRGELRRLTRDHSLVQDQVDRNLITPAEAKRHSMRHVILRAVGIHETLAVDLITGRTLAGDLFLLCSDGLTDMVEEERISEILSRSPDLSETGETLIDSAKSAGGHDNITVTLCKIISPV
jgi:PPM family protein phosphatase